MSDHTYSGYECAACGLPLSQARIDAAGACTCGSVKMVLSFEVD